jgi:hypothetical protein
MGLDAGATGLALKMVVLQFIGVNVQLYFNSRLLGLQFWRYLGHQIVSVGCLLGIAVIAVFCVDQGLVYYENVLLTFILGGVLYTFMVILLIYFQPIILGLNSRDVQTLIDLLKKKTTKLLR